MNLYSLKATHNLKQYMPNSFQLTYNFGKIINLKGCHEDFTDRGRRYYW